MQGFENLVCFVIVGLFFFKTVDWVHRQSLIVSEINGIDFCCPLAAFADLSVHFSETSGFDGDLNAFAVFAVNLIDASAHELTEETNGGLCIVVTVRSDITDFVHMMKIFDEIDVEFIGNVELELFDVAESLQSNHFAHEFDILRRDRLGEQFAFVPILAVREFRDQQFHKKPPKLNFAGTGRSDGA